LSLVFTDVDSPSVHCQRHIHVYHFVYHQTDTRRPLSNCVPDNPLGGGRGLLSFGIVTVSAHIQSKPISKKLLICQHLTILE